MWNFVHLRTGFPFLHSDFKFKLNTKNKVFPIPVSVCCPLNLFNLSIDAFNGTIGKYFTGHILDELSVFNKRFASRKKLRTNILNIGFKGNEWAWQKGDYQDVETFKAVQATWNRAGLFNFIIAIAIFVLYWVFIGSMIASLFNNY